MEEKLLEVDFKVDGKVIDTIKLRKFTPDTLMYEDDILSYTSAYLKVGTKHLPISISIATRKSIAEELGWWQEVSPAIGKEEKDV